MAESNSPKGSSGDFAKKVQRQLSRGKEKVLQKLGKTAETRDEQFEHFLQQFNDQQTDGNRIYKDLRNYLNAVRDMREASRRLSQSLFDVYESDWVGEEDLGAIVEGEDLLWNDYEVKLLDQSIRTMESYVSQFPDVRVRHTPTLPMHLYDKIAKRGRKLVDYDSSRHHLEALQTAKKRDDIKINKAEEEMNVAKSVYESINNDLKEELPVLYDSRIGCYVAVFLAISNLRDTFYKEISTLNLDLQNVVKELQSQYPDKQFSVKGIQYGSLKRRSLMSPRMWKASFSEFNRNYSPKTAQRFSFKSPDKPRHGTLSRESSSLAVSPEMPIMENPTSESRDLDAGSSHSEAQSVPAEEGGAAETPENELKQGEDSNQEEEKKSMKEEKSELKPPAESDNKEDGEKAPPSDSSELSNSCDSESLELQLSAADNSPLHIEEREDSPAALSAPKSNGLENGEVSGSLKIKITQVGSAATKEIKL
uniref:Bridging integrator 2a n=1 Tax=Sphaeramia orbicularis TaxID=375764 RepID=A0A673CQL4_9TELE